MKLITAIVLLGIAVPSYGQATGRVLPASTAASLKNCRVPGLTFSVRLNSLIVPGTPVSMGTSELAAGANNTLTLHPEADEVVYFLNSGGRAFVGKDTVPIEQGLMLYIPRGVPHGFWSPGDHPAQFLWIMWPQALAQNFRNAGIPADTPCPR